MIELHISDNDVTNGNISVGWCLDKETFEYLKKSCRNPQLVIIVVPNEYSDAKELRKVVPLKDVVTYVTFKCSGINKIMAYISENGPESSRGRFLSKESSYLGSVYSNTLLDAYGNFYENLVNFKGTNISRVSNVLVVDVPKDCFAAEPAKWEKAWVNHFFRTKPFDQCEFRRRRVFAYTIQPPLISLSLIARFSFTLLAVLTGARALNLKPLLHPLTYPLSEVAENLFSDGIIFWQKSPDDLQNQSLSKILLFMVKRVALLLVMPIVSIPVLFLLYKGLLLSCLLALSKGIGIVTAMALVVCLVFGFGEIKKYIGSLFDSKSLDYSDVEEQVLVCNGQPKIKLADLPADKRTIKLRFQDLKSKVCRPFSS
jgi:hypothetical protein